MKTRFALTLLIMLFFSQWAISSESISFASVADCLDNLSLIEDKATTVIVSATKEAEAGNQYAQLFLGIIYQDGRGVDSDLRKSLHWYEMAANQDEPISTFSAAEFYRHGFIETDILKALALYESAYSLAFDSPPLITPNSKDVREGIISDSAENIADIYNTSDNFSLLLKSGMSAEDIENQAVKWLETSSEDGSLLSKNNLATRYMSGEGVPENRQKAFEFYRESAEGGYAIAQSNYAKFFWRGEFVDKDLAEAEKWFQKSLDNGFNKAATYLAELRELKQETESDSFDTTADNLIAAHEYGGALGKTVKGKFGIVYGKVTGIGQDPSGDYFILVGPFQATSNFRRVKCIFPKERANIMCSLSYGASVAVFGRCDGLDMHVILRECEFR